jgi:transposase-like protein
LFDYPDSSENVKKNGGYRSCQKFYCRCCKKNFNDKTDTIFHYSHTPLKKWFMVLYPFFVLRPGCSIMEIATPANRRKKMFERLLIGS